MRESSNEKLTSVVKNGGLLVLAGLFAKILSAIYKVPFQNWTGDEGFYVYQQIYPFYALLVAFSLNSFPLIVAKLLIEKRNDECHYWLRQLSFWLSFFGVCSFAIFYFGGEKIALLMGNTHLHEALKSLSWACLIFPFLTLFRGFFQAQDNTFPTSISQMAEQTIRVGILLVVAHHFQTNNIYQMGQIAYHSVWVSALGALIILLYFYRKLSMSSVGNIASFKFDLKFGGQLLTEGLLLTGLNSLLILLQMIDSLNVFQMLKNSGMTTSSAMIQKGIYDRGQPLIQVGLVIVGAICATMLPQMRKAFISLERDVWHKQKDILIRMVTLFAFSAAIGLYAIMPYVNQALFESSEGNQALALYSLNILWMSLIQLSYTINMSMGHGKVALISVIIGCLTKWLANSLLIPHFGIWGASLATNLALIFALTGLWMAADAGVIGSLKKSNYLLKILAMMPVLYIFAHWVPAFMSGFLPTNDRLASLLQAGIGVGLGVIVMLVGSYYLGLIEKSWLKNIRKERQ